MKVIYMLKLLLPVLLIPFLSQSVYTYTLPTATSPDGIHLSDYQGKKILIVNTAGSSGQVAQYGSLEQLYNLYKDSLVIIAVPSNSFGNEQGDDSTISAFVSDTYDADYIISGKIEVAGENIAPLYQWLTMKSKNGAISNPVQTDFQKFLIGTDGKLTGVFSASLDPMSDDIQNAIKGIQ